MRKYSCAFAVMVLIGSAAAQLSFKSFTSPDAKFSIMFPGIPRVSPPIEQKTDEGQVFTEQHYVVADDGAYMLLTSDYPFSTDHLTLNGIAKAQAAACGAPPATVRSDKNVQGRPALLFTVTCPKSENHAAISLIVQAVADGNRLYRIMYGTSEKSDDDRVLRFLLSFHINGAATSSP